MPPVFVLRQDSSSWKALEYRIVFLGSMQSRDIVCAQISLYSACKKFLYEAFETSSWPFPPPLKFLRETGNQNTNDVMLIAEAVGTYEFFTCLSKYFLPASKDISQLEEEGIEVKGTTYKVLVFFL